MSDVFRCMGDFGVSVYMDDLLSASVSIEDHFKTLEEVLRGLQDAKLKLHFTKSRFLMKKTLYLEM